jgi:hypothetical protein
LRILRLIRWYIHNSLPQQRDSIRHPIRSIPVYRITELTEESYKKLISLGNVFDYNNYFPIFMTERDEILEKLKRLDKYPFDVFGIISKKKLKLEEKLLELI